MDRLTPKNENMVCIAINYTLNRLSLNISFTFQSEKRALIQAELEALDREQAAVDQKANSLEKKLRAVMSGKPSNNRNKENSFIRLIRNSIGGGETIRIKLLDIENGELSLTPTGSSDSCSSDSSSNTLSSDGEAHEGGGGGGVSRFLRPLSGQSSIVTRRVRKRRHNPNIKRQRSRSCCVDMLTPHSETINDDHTPHAPVSSSQHPNPSFVTTTTADVRSNTANTATTAATSNSTQPYSLLSSASSNHSSCDNFKICSDDEEQQPQQVRRRHRRRSTSQRRSRSRSKSAGGNCNSIVI